MYQLLNIPTLDKHICNSDYKSQGLGGEQTYKSDILVSDYDMLLTISINDIDLNGSFVSDETIKIDAVKGEIL